MMKLRLSKSIILMLFLGLLCIVVLQSETFWFLVSPDAYIAEAKDKRKIQQLYEFLRTDYLPASYRLEAFWGIVKIHEGKLGNKAFNLVEIPENDIEKYRDEFPEMPESTWNIYSESFPDGEINDRLKMAVLNPDLPNNERFAIFKKLYIASSFDKAKRKQVMNLLTKIKNEKLKETLLKGVDRENDIIDRGLIEKKPNIFKLQW